MTTKEMKLIEINSEIWAQNQCQDVIFNVYTNVEDYLSYLVKQGIIKSYELQMNPYNSGYMISWECSYDNVISPDHIDLYGSLQQNIYIQPQTFFNKYIKEGYWVEIQGKLPGDLPMRNEVSSGKVNINTIANLQTFFRNYFEDVIGYLKVCYKDVVKYQDS